MNSNELNAEANKYLTNKGCVTISQTYIAYEVQKMLVDFHEQQVKSVVLDPVSSSLLIEDFHIGFEYLQYEMDSERYLNKGMIWKKKKYGFNSPRLHKIKELIDNGEIARCNES